SETDTEVIAQLIARHLNGAGLPGAVARVLPLLKGTYGLAVVCLSQPDVVVGARLGSPLAVRVADGETFLASDPSASAGLAKKAAFLEARQGCVLKAGEWQVLDRECLPVSASLHPLDDVEVDNGPGEYPHYMLKEIYEQPEALENALRGRLDDADA